ncbi:MAG: D-alanine--(R)-lactate ligase [Peptococcaceae bacterium]|nr:D-alanine--(R)-lactate ligase [Peptococcaceae bacterium]
MDRIKVAVLFGGCSEEHDVSVKSAIEIAAAIDGEKYEPIYIGITRSGAWRICAKPRAEWENGDSCSAVLLPDKKIHGLLVLKKHGYEIHHVDAVFPVLHGKWGEDGAVQGLLELSGIPYVGCDIQSSAICMDKSLAYTVAGNAGIATPAFRVVYGDGRPAADAFDYPVFVKPARSGSSFGVTKVDGADALDAAIESARRYDGKVLIEQAVSGCEVGCAVLGNLGHLGHRSGLIVGEVDQIRLRHGIFRIHQEAEPEKGSENAVVTTPADLPAEERRRIGETARRIYQALGCRGLSRVDMFLRDDGLIVLNEVNTLPGFTPYSRYPRMMAAAGVTLPELIDRLIVLALEGG